MEMRATEFNSLIRHRSSLVDESESAIARQSSRRNRFLRHDLRDLRVKSYQRGVRYHDDDDRFEGSSGPIARLSRARNLHTGLRLHPRLK